MRRLVGALAVMCVLGVPSGAMAGTDTIYTGVIPHGGAWGPSHSLNSTWVSWYSQAQACITAWDPYDGFYQGVCANSIDTNVGKGFCACRLRQGYGYGANDAYANGYWRQFW